MLLICTSIPFDTLRVPDIHPSSRENWKGWRSHECAVEFRELLNEPSSRKPLITKGLGEERAPAGKEKPIFGRGPETADLSWETHRNGGCFTPPLFFKDWLHRSSCLNTDRKIMRPSEPERISENKVSFCEDKSDHGWPVCRAIEAPNESSFFSEYRKRRDSQSAWRRVSASPNATYQYTWMVVMGQYRISGSIRSHLLHFVRSK